MKNNAIIMKSDLNKFHELADAYGLDVEDKKIYFIDVKHIVPNRFDFRVWANNWQFAMDVLNNGDAFNEMYVSVIEKTDQLSMLTPEQKIIVEEHCVKLIP